MYGLYLLLFQLSGITANFRFFPAPNLTNSIHTCSVSISVTTIRKFDLDDDGNRNDSDFYLDCLAYYRSDGLGGGGEKIDPTQPDRLGRYPIFLPEDPEWYSAPPPDGKIFLSKSAGL